MKTCRECGTPKPLDQFYKHSMMADGYLNKCMDCVRERVNRHRTKNIERIREYDRNRVWRVYDKNKVVVRRLVRDAIARGDLKVQPCERCGDAIGVHAHHDDYSKPLDVIWLCPKHHGERHRELNEQHRKTA